MGWSDAAREAAQQARKMGSGGTKRFKMSPSGRVGSGQTSFREHTLKGRSLAEAKARNAKLMQHLNARRARGKRGGA